MAEPLPKPTDADAVPDLAGAFYGSVLAALHETLAPSTYFEIGTLHGDTLALARCAALAVDPQFRLEQAETIQRVLSKPKLLLFQMPSDEFFATNDPRQLLGAAIDFAFLDGMHHCEFLLRDFMNTERSCRRGSVIALHDCLPVEAAMTERVPGATPMVAPHRQGWWTGDVWRTALLLKRHRPDLSIIALDAFATGLILISNLDPRSTVLADDYERHVARMLSWTLADMGIEALFQELAVESSAPLLAPGRLDARLRA